MSTPATLQVPRTAYRRVVECTRRLPDIVKAARDQDLERQVAEFRATNGDQVALDEDRLRATAFSKPVRTKVQILREGRFVYPATFFSPERKTSTPGRA